MSVSGSYIKRIWGYSLKSFLIKVIHLINCRSTPKVVWSTYMYNDLVQHYNTALSQFLCDLFLCWFDLTGYDWLCSWFHGVCVSTSGEVNSSRATIHIFGSSRMFRVVSSVTFISGFVIIIIDSWYFINGWWTVIYFLIIDIEENTICLLSVYYCNSTTLHLILICRELPTNIGVVI